MCLLSPVILVVRPGIGWIKVVHRIHSFPDPGGFVSIRTVVFLLQTPVTIAFYFSHLMRERVFNMCGTMTFRHLRVLLNNGVGVNATKKVVFRNLGFALVPIHVIR